MWDEKIAEVLRSRIPLKSGAIQLVQILASKGYLMGVATSTRTEQARSHLEKAGLLPYLAGVTDGDLVQKGKPSPEVYHKIAKHFGVNVADCFAFKDSEMGFPPPANCSTISNRAFGGVVKITKSASDRVISSISFAARRFITPSQTNHRAFHYHFPLLLFQSLAKWSAGSMKH